MDTLLAIVIVSVALLSIAGMFIQGSASQRSSDSRSIAYNLAQQKVELLKNKTADEWTAAVPSTQTTFSSVFPDAAPPSVPNNPITFNRTTQAKIATTDTAVTPNINSKLVQAKITVSWTDAKTGNQQVTVNAYFERN